MATSNRKVEIRAPIEMIGRINASVAKSFGVYMRDNQGERMMGSAWAITVPLIKVIILDKNRFFNASLNILYCY